MTRHISTALAPAAAARVPYQMLYSTTEASQIIGSRSALYRLLGAGDLEAVHMARRTRITGDSLRLWIEALPRAKFRGRRTGQHAATP